MTRRTVIQIRVSDEEKVLIAANASEHGVAVSEWVRGSALTRRAKYPAMSAAEVSQQPAASPPPDVPTVAQLSGRTGLPRARCQRALEDGTWEKLL